MLKRFGKTILKIVGVFVILEPIWMLLPFAGFLYGSVLHLQTLARNPETAWLTHFVFPVLTLGPLGPALVLLGLALFLAGAAQVYWAKLRRAGLVVGGLYRFVRHPQYVSLTLFGVGILLTWGRAITFIAFFLMMFLYYYLAKNEEANCRRLFGKEYESYRQRTSFIFPGDRALRSLAKRMPGGKLPAPLRVSLSLLLAGLVCFGTMWLIMAWKGAVMTVPYLSEELELSSAVTDREGEIAVASGTAGGISFAQAGRTAVIRGPWRSATAPGFAERILTRLPSSTELKGFLSFLAEPEGDTAIIFCISSAGSGQPGPEQGRRGPPPDPAGSDRIKLVILRCTLLPGASVADALVDKSKRQIRKACFAPIDLGRSTSEDIVDGKLVTPGPGFPGEDRWDFWLKQLAERRGGSPLRDREAKTPSVADSVRLVMVKAPILRTRLHAEFAAEIFERLTISASLREQLAKSMAGGEIVAVAFPRPGPNWYQEHHRRPQISVFVVLARLVSADAPLDSLFDFGERELLSAFTIEMDFKMELAADSTGEIVVIGPRRDLEERWRFFLSGL